MTGLKGYLKEFSVLHFIWRLFRQPFFYLVFIREFFSYSQILSKSGMSRLCWKDRHPCLWDRTKATGFDPHYIYHTAWAARQLALTKPVEHIDIGSSLYFATIVSAFVPVRFFDYRPAMLMLPGLSSEHADLLSLKFRDNSVSSLSCMHVIEHIGLGRYGDPLDPSGDLKAAGELQRVLAPGGTILIVVPVGRPKTAFNAHRIYSLEQVCDMFKPLKLQEFSLIPDDFSSGMIESPSPELVNSQEYGCGCFRFVK